MPCIHRKDTFGLGRVTQKNPRAMKLLNLLKGFQPLRQVAFCVLAAFGLSLNATRAADHGDAPVASNNQNGDIADVYAFLDPNDNDQVVLIATIRGFIAAGENGNFGIFDPNIRYHFEIENTGAGNTKADKSIDVTFTPRTAVDGPAPRQILQIPQAQKATVTFTNFKDATGKKIKSFSDLNTVGSTTTQVPPGSPPAQADGINDLGTTGIKFFAGMVDDPFFFDIPATGAFIKAVRDNTPDPASAFTRGRDSFAGYNVMGIALRMPATLLRGPDTTTIGVAFYSQRKIVQNPSKKTGEFKGTGVFRTIDRMGNPAVNVVLIPFNRKNEYNQGTPKDDANGRFAGDIVATLTALGTTGSVDDDATPIGLLAKIAVLNGDFLRLETDKLLKPNSGSGGGDNAGSGFPNGRRLRDDVVDTLLTVIANFNTLGDNVNASDPLPNSTFPFLAQPNQPFPNGTIDDKTRN
jgi:hypothetical protein